MDAEAKQGRQWYTGVFQEAETSMVTRHTEEEAKASALDAKEATSKILNCTCRSKKGGGGGGAGNNSNTGVDKSKVEIRSRVGIFQFEKKNCIVVLSQRGLGNGIVGLIIQKINGCAQSARDHVPFQWPC